MLKTTLIEQSHAGPGASYQELTEIIETLRVRGQPGLPCEIFSQNAYISIETLTFCLLSILWHRQQHTPLESWITKSKRIIRVRALSKNPRFADEKTEDQVWQLTNHGANPARQAGAALHVGQAASGLPACFAVCHSHCQAV